MPLIVLCGLPCSGKTRRARELMEYLQSSMSSDAGNRKICLVNDESLHLPQSTVGGGGGKKTILYADSNSEKITRSSHFSAIERQLNSRDIVIADGMNYIKGYRYQLFCLARAQATPHCVVYCDTARDTVRQWNRQECDSRYSDELMQDLLMRFEEPSAFTRWDNPLIVVQIEDSPESVGRSVFNVIFPPKTSGGGGGLLANRQQSAAVNPVMSTMPKPLMDSNHTIQLDSITQDIINAILQQQQSGSIITVQSSSLTFRIQPPLPRQFTLPELRRIRRQFLQINRMKAGRDLAVVGRSFIDYILMQ